MTSVLSTLEMNHGLELILRPLRVIGLRTDSLVMVLQIMLRFLPLLAIRMEQIAKSQASRGAAWDKGRGGIFKRIRLVLPLIIPLFLSSLQQAERTADAMLCRAYGVMPERSHYYEYRTTIADTLLLVAGIILAAAIIIL
jgi:energy-coupling factor transport system permease protein